MTRISRSTIILRPLALLAMGALVVNPAYADIDLRVESRPIAGPIKAFVEVTDGNGPVTGLTIADFAVTLDGAAVSSATLSLPPSQHPTRRVSVVFLIDETRGGQHLPAIHDAVTGFINQMAVGDYAAIVKFNFNPNLGPNPFVQPFMQIDGNTGTNMLISSLATPFWGSDTPPFNAMIRAVDQFVTPQVTLPDGPKAIVLIDDGMRNTSYATLSDVVAHANDNGIPFLTVSVGDISLYPWATALMASLAADTGGTYLAASDEAHLGAVFGTLAGMLNDAYQLTIPQAAVTDCNLHMLEIASRGQTESIAFARCDTTPDGLDFTDQTNVTPGAVVVSNAATITGIASPAGITVAGGEYSIGCGPAFTSAQGLILPGDRVCVRHTAAASFMASTSTLLLIGGVSSGFSSTTSADPQGGGSGGGGGGGGGGAGGGGATGVVELLFALGALVARRRRSA